jgi:predicted membrane-bound spermidine synthase
MLVLVHLLYSVKEDAAPRLGPQQGRWAQTVARLGPLAAGLAFLALFPWLVHRLAPARVAAVHELAGPAAAIVAAILVAALFGTLALARAVLAFAAGRRRRTDVEAQAAAFEPEGAA